MLRVSRGRSDPLRRKPRAADRATDSFTYQRELGNVTTFATDADTAATPSDEATHLGLDTAERSNVLPENIRGRSREHAAGVLSPQPMSRCFGVAVLCEICGEGRVARRGGC